jgi:predicted TIM-barrel fold metal-dependent hydrolase
MSERPPSPIVDADAHVLEPPDLWERYIDPEYRDRAIRVASDPRGVEALEVDGKPLARSLGQLHKLGGYGIPLDQLDSDSGRSYAGSAPAAGMNPAARLRWMDAEGIDASILYPSLALFWETEVRDAALADAYCRAYNRWIVDFCRDSGDRLIPIAHISLGDADLAARELERAVQSGARGAFVAPHTITRKPHGHPDHDPFFARAVALGIPVAIHPNLEPKPPMAAAHFDDMRSDLYYFVATSLFAVQAAFTTLFQYGTFERFPGLELVVLESGAGWIGAWLDRLDGKFESVGRFDARVNTPPGEIFRRQCWISCDPDERSVAAIVELVGTDRFFWASDYPHSEAKPGAMQDLGELGQALTRAAREELFGASAARLYGIELR